MCILYTFEEEIWLFLCLLCSYFIFITKFQYHLIVKCVFVNDQVEEVERLWNACTLYAVKMLSNATCVGEDADAVEGGAAAGFTLTQLLQVTKIRFVLWVVLAPVCLQHSTLMFMPLNLHI